MMERIREAIRQYGSMAAVVAVALSLAIEFGTESIWSAIVGALTAIIGITWEKHQSRKQSRHSREFDLRRDYLLKLADISTIPQQMYNDVQKEGVSISEIGAKANGIAGTLSQCACIMSLPTLKASLQASRIFIRSWCSLCKSRARLQFIVSRLERTGQQIEAIKKELDLLYPIASPENAKLARDLENEHRRIVEAQTRLFGYKGDVHIELMELGLKYTIEYAPYLTALQVAIRKELATASENEFSLAVDVDVFSKMVTEASDQNAAEMKQFAKSITDLANRLSCGDDSVLGKPEELPVPTER